MILYILLGLAAIVLLAYYSFIIKPKKLIQVYKKKFEEQGYRVYLLPFTPMNIANLQAMERGINQHKSCLKQFIDMHHHDVVIGNFLQKVQIKLLHPELMQEFCNCEREWYYQKQSFIMSLLERQSGKGLVSTQGELWKKKRRTMNLIFNFDFITSLNGTIKNKCEEAFQILEEKSKQKNQHIYSIMNLTTEITSSIIFEGFLGGDIKKQRLKDKNPLKFLMEILSHCIEQFGDPVSVVLGARFLSLGLRKKDRVFIKNARMFNAWALDYIRKRIENQMVKLQQKKQEYIPKDIISAMIFENMKKKEEKTYKYTQNDLLYELKTFVIAGTDTTSHLLQIMIYYTFKNPFIEQKLREQINAKNLSDNFTFEDIKTMKYLEAIQKQSVRLVGPGNSIFPRMCVKDHYLKGVQIKKGCIVTTSSITTHNSPQYYKQPEEFRPQRWLNGECDNLHPFSFCGFHGGPRSCIGKHLSLLQSKIALIMFARRYKKVKILCKKLQIRMGLVIEADDFKIKVWNK